MKDLFVPYDLSMKLRRVHFNEKPFGFYMVSEKTKGEPKLILTLRKKNSDCVRPDTCAAPTYQQVVDWFHKRHNIFIAVHYDSVIKIGTYCILIHRDGDLKHNESIKGHGYNTPNEAWPNAIKVALKLIQR